MTKPKRGRKYERTISNNRPLQLLHLNSYSFYILPTDESQTGMGCIYTGKEPPEVGAFYTFKDKETLKKVEVKWIKKLAEGIYRLGLEYF
jgi:hypothetical protein